MIKISGLQIALLVAYATIMATGNLLLETAASRFTSTNGLLAIIQTAPTNIYLWMGLALYTFSFVFWLWLLSFTPLRYAYPIAATSILLAPLLAGRRPSYRRAITRRRNQIGLETYAAIT